jgi:hypothetical protein
MEILSGLLNPTLGFLVTVAFGFWLSKLGKPYNGLLFNFHKLIALATVILAGLAVYQTLKVLDVAVTIFLLLVLAAFSVIALFATGALMSAGKGEYSVMKQVHNLSPFILAITMGATAYLLRSM